LLRHLAREHRLSRTAIQRLVAQGAVLINGAAAPRASWRVAEGDELLIDLPAARVRQRPQPESLPLDILLEDEHLIILNKPAGQVVHPTYRSSSGTLVNGLLAYAADRWRPSLLTRLDKQTSGVVIVAKSAEIHAVLQRAMQRNAVEKVYLAVVKGRPAPVTGRIDLSLDRDPWDRRRVVVRDRGGQASVTQYRRVAVLDDETSLVQCRLITGRTHQIRVHLAAKGWPILGDTTYGVADARIKRQALHAWRVSFAHPSTGAAIEVEAPVPADMQALLPRDR
jgi:23S rRNA pseudouridine1911/1915/1917 synthase